MFLAGCLWNRFQTKLNFKTLKHFRNVNATSGTELSMCDFLNEAALFLKQGHFPKTGKTKINRLLKKIFEAF
jgi:hypothetical protein